MNKQIANKYNDSVYYPEYHIDNYRYDYRIEGYMFDLFGNITLYNTKPLFGIAYDSFPFGYTSSGYETRYTNKYIMFSLRGIDFKSAEKVLHRKNIKRDMDNVIRGVFYG